MVNFMSFDLSFRFNWLTIKRTVLTCKVLFPLILTNSCALLGMIPLNWHYIRLSLKN